MGVVPDVNAGADLDPHTTLGAACTAGSAATIHTPPRSQPPQRNDDVDVIDVILLTEQQHQTACPEHFFRHKEINCLSQGNET